MMPLSMRPSINDFTAQEDRMLSVAVKKHGTWEWGKIATYFTGRSDLALMNRWRYLCEWKKANPKWSIREDADLVYYYRKYRDFERVSRRIETRTPIQCVVRYRFLEREKLIDCVIYKYNRLMKAEKQAKDKEKAKQADRDEPCCDKIVKFVESVPPQALKDNTIKSSFASTRKSSCVSQTQQEDKSFKGVNDDSGDSAQNFSSNTCKDNSLEDLDSHFPKKSGVSIDVETVDVTDYSCVEESDNIDSTETHSTTNSFDNSKSQAVMGKDASYTSIDEKTIDETDCKSVEKLNNTISDANVVKKSIDATHKCVKESNNGMCDANIKITPISDWSLLFLALVMMYMLLLVLFLAQFQK